MKLKARVLEQNGNQILLEFVEEGGVQTGTLNQVKKVFVPNYDAPALKKEAIVRLFFRPNCIEE